MPAAKKKVIEGTLEKVPPKKKKATQVATVAPMTPMAMLSTAVANGVDTEQIEKLMALQERWEANEAKKAYVVAMNMFKADPPEIFKDRHVQYETSKGVTQYDHASLANIVKKIGQSLAKYQLSHRWDIDTLEGGQIKVTCVITHEMGHSENVPLQAGADDSGGKNNIQAKGSTITYLQRYTLLAATGLATADMDDDGRTSEAPKEPLISDDQANEIYSMIRDNGLDKTAFSGWLKTTLKYDSIEEISQKSHVTVINTLKSSIAKKAAKNANN